MFEGKAPPPLDKTLTGIFKPFRGAIYLRGGNIP